MKIVLCHGTFDFLHWGHLKHFEEARKLGDVLIVTLTADLYVNKGPGRPIFREHQRAEMIRGLACVDHVEIMYEKSGAASIKKYRPAFYVKGGDYATTDKHGAMEMERELVRRYGGRLVLTKHHSGISSTDLIRKIHAIYS